MTKSQTYANKYFGHKVVRRLIDEFGKLSELPLRFFKLTVQKGDVTWDFKNFEEFIEEYKKSSDMAVLSVQVEASNGHPFGSYGMRINFFGNLYKSPGFILEIEAPNKVTINRFFEITDEELPNAIAIEIEDSKSELVIFIGHGRNKEWRDLKDHLVDKHHYRIESYESGARAGHTIRDILDDMLSKSNFALLILIAEDVTNDGSIRARQNVIHETGLFQGKLGFSRAIVVMEEGVEEFSNIFGVQQLRFSKGNIKEIFGDVLATIKREFLS